MLASCAPIPTGPTARNFVGGKVKVTCQTPACVPVPKVPPEYVEGFE